MASTFSRNWSGPSGKRPDCMPAEAEPDLRLASIARPFGCKLVQAGERLGMHRNGDFPGLAVLAGIPRGTGFLRPAAVRAGFFCFFFDIRQRN